jgi:prefoldin subunit 5
MKKKPIDAHGEAMDLLHDERDELELALRDIKPKIRKLNQLRQSNDALGLAAATWLFGGNMSELTKDSNELRRRLNNVEETRKLLKADRAQQQQDAWDEEQYILEVTSKTYLPCGCW